MKLVKGHDAAAAAERHDNAVRRRGVEQKQPLSRAPVAKVCGCNVSKMRAGDGGRGGHGSEGVKSDEYNAYNAEYNTYALVTATCKMLFHDRRSEQEAHQTQQQHAGSTMHTRACFRRYLGQPRCAAIQLGGLCHMSHQHNQMSLYAAAKVAHDTSKSQPSNVNSHALKATTPSNLAPSATRDGRDRQ